jgi:hypothetical protein
MKNNASQIVGFLTFRATVGGGNAIGGYSYLTIKKRQILTNKNNTSIYEMCLNENSKNR